MTDPRPTIGEICGCDAVIPWDLRLAPAGGIRLWSPTGKPRGTFQYARVEES